MEERILALESRGDGERLISIIIPVLDDAVALGRLLRRLPPDPRVEIVVVDGGRDPLVDGLAAGRPDVQVRRSPAGRAAQMNAGAGAAHGDWLLFLHADSTLPAGWVDVFVGRTQGARGGWFQFRLDHPARQARLIERGVHWRVRLFRLPYGDQGLFARRDAFAELGGYREMPLMEDVDFIRRLRCAGRLVELPVALITSARRWERDGWCRRSMRNVTLLLLYFAGVPPARLARWYG